MVYATLTGLKAEEASWEGTYRVDYGQDAEHFQDGDLAQGSEMRLVRSAKGHYELLGYRFDYKFHEVSPTTLQDTEKVLGTISRQGRNLRVEFCYDDFDLVRVEK